MTRNRNDPLRRLITALVAAALAAGISACGDSAGPDQGTSLDDLQAKEAPVGGADEADIAAAPDDDTERFLPDQASYLGESITVSGRIVEVFNPHAFVIGEGDLATLVTRSDTALVLQPGTVAQVSGTVGPFVMVDVERQYAADFEDEDFDQFEGAPYIAAENVNLLDDEG
ncbi:MAG: hypothetical protein M3408_08345 [Actinomycetota bacterium]|jgi:hypothetical protein|nr:hypothetical protein [Pseudonocardiales bacterium]MDQ3601242.1 hypothetical protein [Actinomycetota bacterium]